MLDIAVLLQPLNDVIIKKNIHFQDLGPVEGIVILKDQSVLSSENIYIGCPGDIIKIVNGADATSLTIISAGDHDDYLIFDNQININLIVTRLDLIDLYNKLHAALLEYQIWHRNLRRALYENRNLQKLIDIGSEKFKNPIVLLNTGYKVMSMNNDHDIPDSYIDELSMNGYLSFDSISSIESQKPIYQNLDNTHIEYISSITKNYNILHIIKNKGNIIARLFILSLCDHADPYIRALSLDLAFYIKQYLIINHDSQYQINTEFESFISDLLELRINEQQELDERLKVMPLQIKKYYHCVIIGFETKLNPLSIPYIINQLEQIFPYSNSAVYKDDIVLLVRKISFDLNLNFDKVKLMEILTQNNAYASIGNYSKFLTSLRPIYIQTKSALKFGRILRKSEDVRIFYYEDYSMFQVIDLCASSAHHDYHHNNLVYLCHPALLALERYDKKYSTNLKEVLYIYLINNRNSSKTSKDLYIHRNTMNYKIRKIEEIIGQSLDDGTLQERLLFSYHVLEYIEKYKDEDPFTLKK